MEIKIKPKFEIGDIVTSNMDKAPQEIISMQYLEIKDKHCAYRKSISYRTNILDMYHPEEQFQGPYKLTEK